MEKEYFPNTGESFMADGLAACPICGSEAELLFIGNDHTKSRKVTVKCSEIHCRVQRTDAALKQNHEWVARVAIKGWNKRTDDKQCMYCEETVDYSSGIFICGECANTEHLSADPVELLRALKETVSILHNVGFEGDISHITQLINKTK